MSWLDLHTTLFYRSWCHTGEESTFRRVLLTRFHDSWAELWRLKHLDKTTPDYKDRKDELKLKLSCFTPAATIELRTKEKTIVGQRTGLFQLDFDYLSDIEAMKKRVFALPFIAYCSTSCSGNGFYALAMIAEPDKLSHYGDHLFQAFKRQGIKVDTSKGRNVSDYRFVSYDCNMLIRDDPRPLQLLEYSYVVPRPKYKRTEGTAFEHALNAATKKYGQFAPGNRHNFIWLFCRVLRDHGVTKQEAEEYISKNFLSTEEIRSNCITSVFKN